MYYITSSSEKQVFSYTSSVLPQLAVAFSEQITEHEYIHILKVLGVCSPVPYLNCTKNEVSLPDRQYQ